MEVLYFNFLYSRAVAGIFDPFLGHFWLVLGRIPGVWASKICQPPKIQPAQHPPRVTKQSSVPGAFVGAWVQAPTTPEQFSLPPFIMVGLFF